MSRQLPGWKDFKSVKTKEGRRKVQKKIMILFIRKAYANFRKENPEEKLGFSTFAKLRPQRIALITDKDQNVCMCRYHEDVQMAMHCTHTPTNYMRERMSW